jgi:hypothetical protein
MYIAMEEGEEVVLKLHRHWIFIAVRIVVLSFLLVAPMLMINLLVRIGIIDVSGVSIAARMTLWALWVLVLWALFWQFWTTYYMDVWVVTNKRIIDITYLRLFDRNIAIIHLDRVQDITTHIQGIIGTLLRYGAVRIQSAGTDRPFIIDQIANPEALRDTISRLAGQYGSLRVVKLVE